MLSIFLAKSFGLSSQKNKKSSNFFNEGNLVLTTTLPDAKYSKTFDGKLYKFCFKVVLRGETNISASLSNCQTFSSSTNPQYLIFPFASFFTYSSIGPFPVIQISTFSSEIILAACIKVSIPLTTSSLPEYITLHGL